MRSILLIALLLVAAPSTGREVATNYAKLSDQELDARFAELLRQSPGGDCVSQVPLTSELHRRRPQSLQHAIMYRLIGATCAAMEGNKPEAYEHLRALENAVGEEGVGRFGLFAASILGDRPEALKWLRVTAHSGQIYAMGPEELGEAIRRIAQRESISEFDAFSYELTASPDFSRLTPDLQTTFASSALSHALRTRDLSRVEALLSFVHAPSVYITMLTSRKFEAAWPLMERRVGPHMETVAREYVDLTASRLIEKPEDRMRLQDYARALRQAGRFSELADLAVQWLGKPNADKQLTEADGWALNAATVAYDSLDKPAEADRLYDRLAALPADANPWVVNFVINRAGRLCSLGRWDEALAASELASSIAAQYGSPYAQVTTASDHACALYKLGRIDEGARELKRLVPRFADSPGSVAMALICAGQDDEAAKLMAELLRTPDDNELILSYLAEPDDDSESSLPNIRDFILSHQDLRDEALKWVRLLPEDLALRK